MKQLFLILLCIAVFASCSKETTFTKSVENRSSETLLLMIQSSDPGWVDSTVILPNTKTEIYTSASEGTVGSCEINIDSLYLLVFSGDTLKKDFLNAEDWTLTQENTLFGKTDWQECVFGIGDEDF